MNEAAKKWVAALKYGGYKQVQAYLHHKDSGGNESFCCLGVACKLYIEEHGEGSIRTTYDDAVEDGIVAYEGDEQSLPSKVQKWLGLSTEMGDYDVDGERPHDNNLAGLNDAGKSFMDIGSVIESEPKGLFVEA